MGRQFSDLLLSHTSTRKRRLVSEEKASQLREALSASPYIAPLGLCIYGAGSMGRKDMGERSDFDAFILGDSTVSRLRRLQLFAELISINRTLGFPEFSNDGQFLRIYNVGQMTQAMGSPNDDSENLFTARMLLLLESTPLTSHGIYRTFLKNLVEHYFRDAKGHPNFRPLFLLNDILRFWRTLCLNYEHIRNDQNRPWRKKNINLKFSRMLSVFGTILPLIVERSLDEDRVIELASLTPMERLANALDASERSDLLHRFPQFLDDYEFFLALKDQNNIDADLASNPNTKVRIDEAADRFSSFIYDAVMSDLIDPKIRRYLVI